MKDAKECCAVYEPEEADFTVFETGDFWSNTIRIRPLGSTRGAADDLLERQAPGADATFRKDRIYIRTNADAPNWKLMAASYDKPEFGDWQTLIPEQEHRAGRRRR